MAMSLEWASLRTRMRFAAAAWVVACSAGVDGYHLAGKGGNGGDDGSGGSSEDGGASESGGASSNGGTGGRVSDPGDGGRAQGGDSGGGNGGSGKPPSNGGSGELNTGGAPLQTSGGAGSGNAGSGGKGAGGAGNGGAGGKGSGGGGNGGAGTGGASGGAGGMTSTGPGDPTLVPLSNTSLTGITAAAWDGSFFFLLEAAAHQFWTVNPANGMVSGPMPLPTGVAPYAFGVSDQGVYVIAANKVYRVSRTLGYTSESGATIPSPTPVKPSGAFAGSYFLIGDLANPGTTPAYATNIGGTLVSAGSLGAIYAVSSDRDGFGYSTFDAGVGTMLARQLSGSSLTQNGFACSGNIKGAQEAQISVYKNTVAWVKGEVSTMLLYIATNSNGMCPIPAPQPITYGAASNLPVAVGLINDGDALVIEKFASSVAELQIHGRSGQHKPLGNVFFNGNTQPKSVVVGSGHYAAVVSGYTPAIVRF